jgi:hypothetical protein
MFSFFTIQVQKNKNYKNITIKERSRLKNIIQQLRKELRQNSMKCNTLNINCTRILLDLANSRFLFLIICKEGSKGSLFAINWVLWAARDFDSFGWMIQFQNITFYKPFNRENWYSCVGKRYNVSSIVIMFIYCESRVSKNTPCQNLNNVITVHKLIGWTVITI